MEGLRLDEAMHDLTILASGIYGKPVLPQNGAPLRLVVPWKYGFKGIKSIVKIDLTEEMPISAWMTASFTQARLLMCAGYVREKAGRNISSSLHNYIESQGVMKP